jgi:hypothetical protein
MRIYKHLFAVPSLFFRFSLRGAAGAAGDGGDHVL